MTEQILFNILKTKIPDLQKTDQFSYRDAYSPKFKMTFELKCRQKHYDTLLIEKIKWDKLIKHNPVRYINSTPIGIFSFDLQSIPEPMWMEWEMPKTTEFDITQKVPKLVGFLFIQQAQDLSHLLKSH